jgi:hypothetical protein
MNIDLGHGGRKNAEPVLEDKNFSGISLNDHISSLVYNPLRDEVVIVCYDDKAKLVYFTVEIDLQLPSERLKSIAYKASNYSNVPPLKFDLPKTEILNSKPIQTQFLTFNGVPYLIVLRENKYCEIVRNFSETILADTQFAIERFFPAFSG